MVNLSKRTAAAKTKPRNPAAADVVADVLVIGGGLNGGTLSLALAGAGLKVVTVDTDDPARWADAGFDGRASAIALSSKRVLEGVGLWRHLQQAAAPIQDIRVSDGAAPLFLHYDHTQLGDDPFGYMVENRAVFMALNREVPQHDNLSYLAPDRVVEFEFGKRAVRATLQGGLTVEAAVAIGCDGRTSQTRVAAGIGLTRWPYHQVGIVCTVEHARPHNFCAQERFLPSGPFAILPLTGSVAKPGCRSSIVWTERADLAPLMLALDDDDFLEELSLRFGDYLGDLKVIGPRFAYPLSLQFAESYTGHRVALAGDAAHGMHPIAGQGFNMGLRDIAALAEVLVEAKQRGEDIGSAAVLQRYGRWRRFDNALMLAMTDLLTKLFSNDIRPLKLIRDLGMAAVNQMVPLKKLLMRHAMGTVGELPKLMRGEPL